MEGETLFGSAGNAHMAYSSAFLALGVARAGERARVGGAAPPAATHRGRPTASASG